VEVQDRAMMVFQEVSEPDDGKDPTAAALGRKSRAKGRESPHREAHARAAITDRQEGGPGALEALGAPG